MLERDSGERPRTSRQAKNVFAGGTRSLREEKRRERDDAGPGAAAVIEAQAGSWGSNGFY